ncbi:MAG: hypothetical protein LIO92_00655 [Clostridiales bacterium]|nr:hypothetical protein [Clostridiales bacterium]
MCKAWREESILATIEAWREVEIPEADIKKRIMAKYDLTEKEAAEYMLKKSA